ADATVRFRRALTVLPKDSAWWRSATWNLGTSLAAEGKDEEALEAMISSYAIDRPNIARYILIEQLWLKVKQTRKGLEQRIGPSPLPDLTASASPMPTVEPPIVAEESPTPEDTPTPDVTPSPEESP